MKRVRMAIGVVENISVWDRIIRFLIGIALLVPVVYQLQVSMTSPELVSDLSWESYAALASFYPLLTAMLGWDPFYSLFHAKSCGTTDRNRCGTLGYQIDAALGHHVDHDKGYEIHGRDEKERVKGVDVGGNYL